VKGVAMIRTLFWLPGRSAAALFINAPSSSTPAYNSPKTPAALMVAGAPPADAAL
jgi:hypothetical protein